MKRYKEAPKLALAECVDAQRDLELVVSYKTGPTPFRSTTNLKRPKTRHLLKLYLSPQVVRLIARAYLLKHNHFIPKKYLI